MTASVVVFAVGNPSRGDDALGPELCGRLEKWLETEHLTAQCELIEDFQLQVEHALDLHARELVLFIDAGAGTPGPFDFGPSKLVDRIGHSTHALEPGSVLQVFRVTEGKEPPPAFTICIAGCSFELGEEMTNQALIHAEQAFAFVCDLLRHPDAAYWASRATAEGA